MTKIWTETTYGPDLTTAIATAIGTIAEDIDLVTVEGSESQDNYGPREYINDELPACWIETVSAGIADSGAVGFVELLFDVHIGLINRGMRKFNVRADHETLRENIFRLLRSPTYNGSGSLLSTAHVATWFDSFTPGKLEETRDRKKGRDPFCTVSDNVIRARVIAPDV
jgi:hypothetical protein